VFRDAGLKTESDANNQAPDANADNLDPNWRKVIPTQVLELAAVWDSADAWDGMSTAGGVTMPASMIGVVALNEMIIHGWDLARATDQQIDCDSDSLIVITDFNQGVAEPEHAALRDNVYGPVIEMPETASDFDKVLGLTGRLPSWRA
jgi:uncharacterized protein (TIGR03086 family)